MSDIEFPRLVAAKIGRRERPQVFRMVNTYHGPRFDALSGLAIRYQPHELTVVEHEHNNPDAVRIISEAKRFTKTR